MRSLSFVLLAAVPAIVSAQDPAPAKIDAIFSRFDHRDSPGCILAVSRAGKISYQKGYGMADLERDVPITPASIFHVASISKQFTAMSILLLEEQGKLSIDDDVRKYIPELPDYGKRITLRNLVNHTSGIRDQWTLLELAGWREDDLITEDDVMWAVTRQRALNFEPGAEYLYSNSGFTLLGVIVKRVSGKSLRQFADEQIFKPLGMTQTHFHDDHTMLVPHRTSAYQPRQGGGWSVSIPVFDTYGATSLFTTAEDLLRWEQNFAEPRVGTPALLARMQEVAVLNDGTPSGYAMGLAVAKHRGVREVGHSGADAGYRADVERYPDQQLAVAALCNASNSNPGMLTRQVADLYLGSALAPEPSQARQAGEISLPTARLTSLAGVYRRETGDVIRLGIREGKLVVAEGAPTELVPLSENRFGIRGVEGEVTFDSSAAGHTMRLRRGAGRPQLYTRMTPFRPAPAQLAAFAGRYRSSELDTEFRIVASDSSLTIADRRPGSIVMRPIYSDAFRGPIGVTEFTRDASGRITGFVVNAGRVRGLRFDRVE
ncbi:MAG: serine hydrolase domain-containing protein [Gemmatimonadaceae bacterium]